MVAGSTYAPLPIDLRDAATGLALDLTGATVTITIIDQATGQIIVEDGEGEQNEDNPYLVEFFFTDDQANKITVASTWLAQWTLTAANGRKHLVPIIGRIPVFPRTV